VRTKPLTATVGGEYCLARPEIPGPNIMADVDRFFCVNRQIKMRIIYYLKGKYMQNIPKKLYVRPFPNT
jgi:hypothetical protein